MLSLKFLSDPRILSISVPRPWITSQIQPNHLTIQKQYLNPRKLVICAKDDGKNGDEDDLIKEGNSGDGNGDENQQAPFFKLRWTDLLLDPDPDNVLAVGLTGLLTWASAQVVWQLLAVSFAIVVAALKYSFVAALLIFILVALL